MNKEEQAYKQFLEDQVKWCKKQDRILAEIESKLYEMKELAVYASDNYLSSAEIREMNSQLNGLKKEVTTLESQLRSPVH